MRKLRLDLFGVDRLPVNKKREEFSHVALYPSWGDRSVPVAYLDLVLMPQKPAKRIYIWTRQLRKLHRSAHRLFAKCDCGRLVPVGRLAQHKH